MNDKIIRVLICGGRDFGKIPLRPDKNGADKNHPAYAAKKAEYAFVITTFFKELSVEADNPMGYDWKDERCPTIIAGGATGADNIAADIAVINFIPYKEFPAAWRDMSEPCKVKYRKDGSAYNALAGFKRNQRMIDEGKPDVVFAFPGGNGTADMVKRARAAGVPVKEFAL